MKITKIIRVPNVAGGFNETQVTISNEHRGRTLGLAIREWEKSRIIEQISDHIESENSDTMTFSFGVIRKDKIESLEWHDDGFGSAVARVRFADPRNFSRK